MVSKTVDKQPQVTSPAWHLAALAVPAVLVAPAFLRIVGLGRDHRVHLAWIEAGTFPNHGGFHATVEVASRLGLTTSTAAALTLAVAFGLTSWIGFVLIRALSPLHPLPSLLAALGFSIAAPLPKWWDWPGVYLGNLTGVVWHNPTTVFALPFGIGCAGAALVAHRAPSHRRLSLGFLLVTLVLAVACAFTKPNFLLALAPAALLAAMLNRPIPRPVAAVVAAACAVGVSAYLTSTWISPQEPADPTITSEALQASHSIAARPLYLWRQMSQGNVLSSFFSSLLFPLAATTLLVIRKATSQALGFAWIVFGFAMAQWVLLVEAGPRINHANFYWAVVPSVHLLFICSFCALERMAAQLPTTSRGPDTPLAICRLCLLMHIASGAWFLYRSTLTEFA